MTTTTTRFLVLAALWGSSFSLIKVTLEGLTPGQLVLTRLVLGAAVLLIFATLRGVRLPRGFTIWRHVVVAAMLGNIAPFLLLSYGERTTGAGTAGVLIGATPLITLSLAALRRVALPTEKANRRKLVGLAVGFVGVVLVVGPWQGAAGSVGTRLACLGAALSYAAGFVYVRKFLSPRDCAPCPGRVTAARRRRAAARHHPVPHVAPARRVAAGRRLGRSARTAGDRRGLRALLPADR